MLEHHPSVSRCGPPGDGRRLAGDRKTGGIDWMTSISATPVTAEVVFTLVAGRTAMLGLGQLAAFRLNREANL